MRADVVRMYKDIHTWVGIVSGLCLFIAFYAGALTMFERPIQRWASPPSNLPPAVSLTDTPRLIEATLAAEPRAAHAYEINLNPRPEAPARMSWFTPGPSGERGDRIRYSSALTAEGELVVRKAEEAPVGQFIDVLHQQVGLPFDHEISMPIMGAICLLYAIALVSGVIILIPSLSKDLFALRIGRNLKRMWLDVHNVLGVFSLPFHIVMALTAVVFAFHDQFYDTQAAVAYQRPIEALFAEDRPKPPAAVDHRLEPLALVAALQKHAPGIRADAITYQADKRGGATARVQVSDPRYGMRGPTYGFITLDASDGRILQSDYAPGLQGGWAAIFTAFFALHFGNYGGEPVRWGYFLLGLAGAFLFYSGNLIWVEARRRRLKRHATGEVAQSTSTRVLGALTVGVSLGCVAGLSLTLAAAKWLPGRVENLALAHSLIYYAVFLAAVGWAFARGAARAGPELLHLSAVATALVPLSSLAGAAGLGAWSRADDGLLVDLVALAGAAIFLVMGRIAARRARTGPRDSVWADPRGEAAMPAE